TGFTQKRALDRRARLNRLEQKAAPFTPPPPGSLGRHAHWVKPDLVCEVVFTEWTTDGKIRHPSFQGLRADKTPREVGREKASAAAPARREGRAHANSRDDSTVAGVSISHPDRVVYPD